MAESWTISVGGRIYGPYSLEQMQDFHAEKRLADHSLVARDGEEKFHPASEDPELATWFQPAARETTSVLSEAPHRFGAQAGAEKRSGGPSHFVIVADMKSHSIASLEDEIFALGPAQRFGAQAWALSSEISISTIRTALAQKLGKLDTLFIVDATHDKAAWFNFGPEIDSRIRRMWSRPTEHHDGEKRAIKRS